MKNFLTLLFIGFVSLTQAQNVGINNTDPQTTLDINGDMALRSGVMALTDYQTDNVNTTTDKKSLYRFVPPGPLFFSQYYIRGIDGGVDGRSITIVNASDYSLIFAHLGSSGAGSTTLPENQILTSGGDLNIPPNGSLSIIYDSAASRWRVTSVSKSDVVLPTALWASDNTNLLYNLNNGNVQIGDNAFTDTLNIYSNTNIIGEVNVANIKTTGEIKPNGTSGLIDQVLTSNGNGTMQWASPPPPPNGAIGYGPWGDCTTSGYITDYQPITNIDGTSNDNFGTSVSISGDYAIVGAPNDTEGGFNYSGSATIYKRNTSTGLWEIQGAKLINPNPADGDNFGYSVSISGDYAIVGAPYDDEGNYTANGSAIVYKRNTSTELWEVQGIKLINPNPANDDNFGYSVSISGDYAIVGAYKDDEGGFNDTGSASIYKRNTSTGIWEVLGSKLINVSPAQDDYFGYCVSINGDYALVGAPYDDEGNYTANGSASIYKRNTSTGLWEVLGTKLINPVSSYDDLFGYSVSVIGDYAIISAPGDDDESVPIYGIGSASIYKRNNSSGIWEVQGTKLINQNPAPNDFFGNSVSISSDYAIVGVRNDDEGGYTENGSATIYKRIGGNIWESTIKITKPKGQSNIEFGSSVSIDGTSKSFLIGANGAYSDTGMAFFGKSTF
jgi:FG-GAP repeat